MHSRRTERGTVQTRTQLSTGTKTFAGKKGQSKGFMFFQTVLLRESSVFTMLELESFHHPREGPGGTSGESPAQFHPWSIPDRMMQGYSCHGWQYQSRWIGVCGL